MSYYPFPAFDDEEITKATICRECKHTDCEYWRNLKKLGCDICKKSFESGESVTMLNKKEVHVTCINE